MKNEIPVFNSPKNLDPYNVAGGLSEGHPWASLAQQMPSTYVPILCELQIGGGTVAKYGVTSWILWMLGMSMNYSGWMKLEDGPAIRRIQGELESDAYSHRGTILSYIPNDDVFEGDREYQNLYLIRPSVETGWRQIYFLNCAVHSKSSIVNCLVDENFNPHDYFGYDNGPCRSWDYFVEGGSEWLMSKFARYPRVERIRLLPDGDDHSGESVFDVTPLLLSSAPNVKRILTSQMQVSPLPSLSSSPNVFKQVPPDGYVLNPEYPEATVVGSTTPTLVDETNFKSDFNWPPPGGYVKKPTCKDVEEKTEGGYECPGAPVDHSRPYRQSDFAYIIAKKEVDMMEELKKVYPPGSYIAEELNVSAYGKKNLRECQFCGCDLGESVDGICIQCLHCL